MRETEAVPVIRGEQKLPDYGQAPQVIFWEITRACALACIHCRAQAQPKRHPLELTTEEGFRLMDQMAEFGHPILVISGGDPLMRRDVFDLIAYGIEKGLRVSLSPSATALVTPKVLKRVKEAGISRLSFSLDGSCPEIHDTFRGVSGSFGRTMECIRDALEAGLSLHVNTTVSRHNVADLPAIAQIITQQNALLWDLFFLVPTGRGKREDVLSAAEHEAVFQWILGFSRQVSFGVRTTLGQPYRRVALQRELQEKGGRMEDVLAAFRRSQPSTNDGKGVCFVSHLGEVYPSGFLPISAGNVRKESLATIYRESSLFRELRDVSLLKGKCGRCPFNVICGGCRARAYAFTGDYLEADPTCPYQPPDDKAPLEGPSSLPALAGS